MTSDQDDRRIFDRKRSLNFLDFVVMGKSGDVLTRGLARTLNVSEGGLLVETSKELEAGQPLVVTLGLDNELVDLRARVAHVERTDDTTCKAGVEFLEMTTKDQQTLNNYLKALKKHLAATSAG